MKLTESDVNSIKFFHEERGDIARYTNWENIKSLPELSELVEAIREVYKANKYLDFLVKELDI